MPNPDSEETGLAPTEIQMAIAVAKLNAAKRINPDEQTIFVSSEPVIVSSPHVTINTVINPGYDTVIIGPVTTVIESIHGPRPSGPLVGRSAGLPHAGSASVQVGEDFVTMTFYRTGPGEYVPEARPLSTIPSGWPRK